MSMDTCNGGSDRQGNGAEAQEEPDGLRGSRGSHNFESYRSQEWNEASVEKSHDQGEDDQGLEDEALKFKVERANLICLMMPPKTSIER